MYQRTVLIHPVDLPMTEKTSKEVICLPIYQGMENIEVIKVIEILRSLN